MAGSLNDFDAPTQNIISWSFNFSPFWVFSLLGKNEDFFFLENKIIFMNVFSVVTKKLALISCLSSSRGTWIIQRRSRTIILLENSKIAKAFSHLENPVVAVVVDLLVWDQEEEILHSRRFGFSAEFTSFESRDYWSPEQHKTKSLSILTTTATKYLRKFHIYYCCEGKSNDDKLFMMSSICRF